MNKKLYEKWLTESKIKPMTRTESEFAKFLFSNFKQLTPIGNLKPAFESIYDFIKENRSVAEEIIKAKDKANAIHEIEGWLTNHNFRWRVCAKGYDQEDTFVIQTPCGEIEIPHYGKTLDQFIDEMMKKESDQWANRTGELVGENLNDTQRYHIGHKLVLNSNDIHDEEVEIIDLTSDGVPFCVGENFEGWVPVLKTITTILLLLFSFTLSAQRNIECDTVKAEVCCELGHYPDGIYGITGLPTQSETVETKTATMRITFNPNLKLYNCGRCKCFIEEPVQERPDTVYLWTNTGRQ